MDIKWVLKERSENYFFLQKVYFINGNRKWKKVIVFINIVRAKQGLLDLTGDLYADG